MTWAPAVTAVSTAIIALGVLVGGAVALILLRHLIRLTDLLHRVIDGFDRDTRPVLEQARTVLTETNRIAGKVGREVERITDATGDVRERVLRAVDGVEDRLTDLDALLDVIQEEVEETVLDVGAALRTTRRGASVFRTIRRALGGGDKRGRRRRR